MSVSKFELDHILTVQYKILDAEYSAQFRRAFNQLSLMYVSYYLNNKCYQDQESLGILLGDLTLTPGRCQSRRIMIAFAVNKSLSFILKEIEQYVLTREEDNNIYVYFPPELENVIREGLNQPDTPCAVAKEVITVNRDSIKNDAAVVAKRLELLLLEHRKEIISNIESSITERIGECAQHPEFDAIYEEGQPLIFALDKMSKAPSFQLTDAYKQVARYNLKVYIAISAIKDEEELAKIKRVEAVMKAYETTLGSTAALVREQFNFLSTFKQEQFQRALERLEDGDAHTVLENQNEKSLGELRAYYNNCIRNLQIAKTALLIGDPAFFKNVVSRNARILTHIESQFLRKLIIPNVPGSTDVRYPDVNVCKLTVPQTLKLVAEFVFHSYIIPTPARSNATMIAESKHECSFYLDIQGMKGREKELGNLFKAYILSSMTHQITSLNEQLFNLLKTKHPQQRPPEKELQDLLERGRYLERRSNAKVRPNVAVIIQEFDEFSEDFSTFFKKRAQSLQECHLTVTEEPCELESSLAQSWCSIS